MASQHCLAICNDTFLLVQSIFEEMDPTRKFIEVEPHMFGNFTEISGSGRFVNYGMIVVGLRKLCSKLLVAEEGNK